MPDQKPRVRIRRGRDHKKRKTYLLNVDQGEAFRLRRVDMMGLLLEGALPTPLLSAVGRFQNLRGAILERNADIGSIFESLTREDRASFIELMRRVAVLTAVEPRMTHSKRAAVEDQDLLWVGGYSDVAGENQTTDEPGDVTIGELMLIWRATLGEAGVVTMSDDDALEFRTSESSSDGPVLPDGSGVRAEAEFLGTHTGHTQAPRTGGVRITHN